MDQSELSDDMPLTKAVKAWMDSEGWDDDIQVGEDRSTSRVATSFEINDQPYRMFLEANEKDERFSVYLYSPFHVPPARMPEMSRLLNRINTRLGLGRLACHDDDESNPVQFLAVCDVEGGSLSAGQVGTMIAAAVATFRPYGELLAAAVFTKQQVDALWEEYLEDREKKEAEKVKQKKASVPPEL